MLCKVRIQLIAHGNNNNLHLNVHIGGTRKKGLFLLKMVLFFDNLNAYILHSNLHPDYIDILDFDKLTQIIQNELSEKDFVLQIFSKSDFFNKNVKTFQILNKLK